MKWEAGAPPFGYTYNKDTKKLTVSRDEKKILNIIFKLAVSGKGVLLIASYLNERKILTKRGKIWRSSTLQFILNPEKINFYAGRIGNEKGDWEPIIDEGLRNKLIPIVKIREKQQKNEIESAFLASQDIFRCGFCGGTTSTLTVGKYRYYTCLNKRQGGASLCANSSNVAQEIIDKIIMHEMELLAPRATSIFKQYAKCCKEEATKNISSLATPLKNADLSGADRIADEIKKWVAFSNPVFPFEGEVKVEKSSVPKFFRKIEMFTDRVVLHFNIPYNSLFNFEKVVYYEA